MNKEPKNSKISFLMEKMVFFQEVIQNTILNCQKNKLLEIINTSESNLCMEKLYEIHSKIKEIKTNIFIGTKNSQITETETNKWIDEIQNIANELSSFLKDYGTRYLEDLLRICFGNSFIESMYQSICNEKLEDLFLKEKYELLKKYFRPTSYRIILKKEITSHSETNANKRIVIDNIIIDESNNCLDCFEFPSDNKSFYLKVYGIKLYVENNDKGILINGILDDISIDFINNKYIEDKKNNWVNISESQKSSFSSFISSFNLKDYIIYRKDQILNIYNGYISNLNSFQQNNLNQNIKDFLSYDNFNKRRILIQLLLESNHSENIYLSYLLYDLLSTDTNGNIDSRDQVQIYDSFTLFIKKQFKHAVKKMIQYNNEILHFDMNKIPLEQQILLLKAPMIVKEKAMTKLKEIKSKNEDNGSKARQYLDGLLKIPFQIYKREPSLYWMNEVRASFQKLIVTYEDVLKKWNCYPLPKEKYTNIEIVSFVQNILFTSQIARKEKEEKEEKMIKNYLLQGNKKMILQKCTELKDIYDFQKEMSTFKILKKDITLYLEKQLKKMNHKKRKEIYLFLISFNNGKDDEDNYDKIEKDCSLLWEKFKMIQDYLKGVKESLDKSVYGHEKAKKQIETIVAQWLNGEQDGYCFGFEGPPGVGKTSLAKYGLSECLKDENGMSRPFSMIQMGGDSNGSTLHGHNYTYVGSTWGSIVQILMDKRCMNPIIFIDEVDKISKTEHGKEITGILTHLLDTTQNDCFQDKYFYGIDLDLSKALFILSYNDVNSIDKILLDRIHRIQFQPLSIQDKLIIANKYLLPEIYKKVGLENVILIKDETLIFIIEEYTSESGVRKLKEILFEIIGDFNVSMLKRNLVFEDFYLSKEINSFPIEISIQDIQSHYLKEKKEIKHKKIHKNHCIGIINGLWANSYGQGGVIAIQSRFFPCEKFLDLKLTGMQGDVMKESMNVALTLAWELTPVERKKEIYQLYNNTSKNIHYGIHIHCPEGSTPKDGPSAGVAITVVLYSLFNNKRIRCDFALTGEISLDGTITEIGGLDMKILGGIKAGVKHFLYPKENEKDFQLFMEKYSEKEILKSIFFHSISNIKDVFPFIFDEDVFIQ